MKCQMCGKGEAIFHYSSSVNGCVTEAHLCSGCAAESGYDLGQFFNSGSLFDIGGLFQAFNPTPSGRGGFMPIAWPVMSCNTDALSPFVARPRAVAPVRADFPGCGCGGRETEAASAEVDGEMMKRRELNMQMRIAVENQDFEKAAQLRDQIKELES